MSVPARALPVARLVALAVALGLAFALALALAGCSRPAPDATPDGAVRVWLEKMEDSDEDPSAARDAYALLGPGARTNLAERAERASLAQGRRVDASEMLAEGRFGLKFRPKAMTVKALSATDATVEVTGADPREEHASIRCAREGAGWRVEPDLPPPTELLRWRDGG